MTIDDQIKNEKLQYDINKEAEKLSALSSGKIDNYEYLSGEEILPSNQKQITEQAKFTYWKKQIDTLKDLKAKDNKKKQIEPIENKSDDHDDKLLIQKKLMNF